MTGEQFLEIVEEALFKHISWDGENCTEQDRREEVFFATEEIVKGLRVNGYNVPYPETKQDG